DLAGASVATVYPRLTRELLPVDVTLVDVSGSVEIAPRLGLADAIVDLVSSGNTLRTNGLRALGVLLESEAVLVASDDERAAPFASMLRAVVEARRHRYLMLNAPEAALPAIAELVAPRVPSVLPLARAAAAARRRARGRAGRHARTALGPARHDRGVRAAQPDLDAGHVRRARTGRRRSPHRRVHAARGRARDRRRRGGARDRRGLGARRPSGDRLSRVRRARRQDRRPRQPVRERGEARGLARRPDRPARRALRGRRGG